MLFVTLFFFFFLLKLCWKILYAFCPTLCQIILDFAWLCFAPEVHAHQHSRLEQVPVLQKSISKGIQTLLWYRCKPNLITEGEEKGRVSQAHAKLTSRASFWVKIRMHWSRVTRTLTLVHGLKNVVPVTPTWNFVVAGHRPIPTDSKTQFRVAYSSESDIGRPVSNCFTKSCFCQNCWCRVFWHRLLHIAKSCLQWKMPTLC